MKLENASAILLSKIICKCSLINPKRNDILASLYLQHTSFFLYQLVHDTIKNPLETKWKSLNLSALKAAMLEVTAVKMLKSTVYPPAP